VTSLAAVSGDCQACPVRTRWGAALLTAAAAGALLAPATPATATVYSPAGQWVHATAKPHQVDDHRFRLRTRQWVEVRATTEFVLLDSHLRPMERGRARSVASFQNPGYRVHRLLGVGDYVVRVQLPEQVTVQIPYDLRFGPLRETVVMSSSTWDEGVNGTPTVSGEVINETPSARSGIRVRASYVASDGRVLTTRSVPVLRRVVPSRQSAMFSIGRPAPAGTRRVRVVVVDPGVPTQVPDPVVTADPYDDYDCGSGAAEEHCSWAGPRASVSVKGSRAAVDVVLVWGSMDAHGHVSRVQYDRLGDLEPGTYDRAIGGDVDIIAEAGSAAR
jgi:hypothetical protein